MSTENLTGLDALTKANKVVADSARKRGVELEEEIREANKVHERQLEDADIAKRALVQRHRDEQGVREHEATQVAFVLAGDQAANSEPQAPPLTPVTPAPVAEDHDDSSNAGNPPTTPQPAVPPAADTPNPNGWSRLDPRNRSRSSQLFAILMGILFAWIAYQVGLAAAKESLQAITTVLWTIGWGLIGAVLGLLIGSFVDQE